MTTYDPEGVLVPLRAYAAGHATGDPAYFRTAFLPTAHVEGIRDGELVSWDLDDYCSRFTGASAPDESDRVRTIDQVTVTGSVATAVMTLRHGPETFTDMFVLLEREPGVWRIASKAYHRS
ncbi:nuclear transport factor 2 family protein [Nocardioides sp.]|uniref:nuclear transport factor 2 family protein n=1 Tax=Nocardioides sp. TaxID=35761 RepID=UPI001A2657F7|nr:nuclear transport factor 2 family protein [Nocardioides sp.]MBJ7358269.1 nuclear transport factor 2 family protein [Nocardioides sp.]